MLMQNLTYYACLKQPQFCNDKIHLQLWKIFAPIIILPVLY